MTDESPEPQELESILKRVERTKTSRSDYNVLAEKWERMWALKLFPNTPEQSIKMHGQEQVTLPTPFNVVQLGARLINSVPNVNIPAAEGTADAEKAAQKTERWVNAALQQANRQQSRNIIADAIWMQLVRGRACFEVKWVKDELPKKLRKKLMPILVRTLDPLCVGIKHGPFYTLWAFHYYRDEIVNIKAMFPDIEIEGFEINDETVTETTMVDVIDYWYTADDGSVWNAVLVNKKFVKEPQKTDYPEVPIIEIYGDGAPLAAEQYKGMSILHPITELWPYQSRLASQMATGLLWHFWPAVTVSNEHGEPLPNLKLRPGEQTEVPWGTKIEVHQMSPNVPLATTVQAMIDAAAQESTFPGVMYGKEPGSLQAGFGVSMLADQAKGRTNNFRENLEFGIARVIELMLGLVKAFGGKDGVDVWGKDERNGGTYRLNMKASEIGDFYESAVSLKPVITQDTMQKETLGLRLVDGKVISRQTYREQYAGIPVPIDEQARIEFEEAMETDIMKPYKYEAAVKKFFGNDWANVINNGETPDFPFGPKKPPEGQGGPPQGGPGGPNMLPPQGMPPQGPPPGPQGPPPEVMAQMMAQQGGPGPQMPPGQSPEMITAPQGGGIPAEMQGQLTPEALGFPSNMDPIAFAQLTGQPLPPAEELQRLEGKKRVGGKKSKK
ncbi:hypothetical protein BH10CHL1_BH10CHL1_18050 [soil metagenome]